MFVTQRQIDLKRSADSEPWKPELNVQVVLISSEKSNLAAVSMHLTKSENVGLVILGKTVSRYRMPSLIALVTSDIIFVFCPKDEQCVDLLRIKLQETDICFWTTQGMNEADCLLHNLNIDLTKTKQCNDCQALHALLMNILKYESDASRSKYPILAQIESKKEIVTEDWQKLVKIWLDIDPQEIAYDSYQLDHLETRPLTQTGLNIIKKRCFLVLNLAGCMNKYLWQDFKILSASYHRRLSLIENKNLYNLIRNNLIQPNQTKPKPEPDKQEDSDADDTNNDSAYSDSLDDYKQEVDIEAFAHLAFGKL